MLVNIKWLNLIFYWLEIKFQYEFNEKLVFLLGKQSKNSLNSIKLILKLYKHLISTCYDILAFSLKTNMKIEQINITFNGFPLLFPPFQLKNMF